jgi:hypothetical protein
MKKYDDLNFFEKEHVVKFAFYKIVDGIVDGTLEVDFVVAANQAKIKDIQSGMGATKPNKRYRALMILNDKPIRAELEKLALATAEGTFYNDDGTPITTVLETV